MQWINTGRQIGRAVKNVQRLRQIVNVFAKHGFADVFYRMGLTRFIPTRFGIQNLLEKKAVSERLRLAFEELGPTFVKLGQLISTRTDLLPEHVTEELKKLQDHVHAIPYAEVKAVVERELKQPVHTLFRSFNEHPLASASIAQVHEAILHDGEEVVVKVQRPGIEKIIRSDISILEFLAKALERYIPEMAFINPSLIVKEFAKTLNFELDFLVEANNMNRFRANMEQFPEIVVPVIYKVFSTRRVLTQEKLKGIPFNNLEALNRAEVNKTAIVAAGARAFFKSILVDGLFHGDLHGGNLFVLPDNRIGIVDFGIMGRLSETARDQLLNIVLALLNEDFENLCYQYVELGPSDTSIDLEAFQRDVRNSVSPYLGLSISEVNSGRLLLESTRIAAQYKIRISGDWMMVFKAIFTIEGMGRSLDPDFNFLEIGQSMVEDLIKNQYSLKRLTNDLIWLGKDASSLLKMLPRNIKWMLRKFKANNYAFELKIPQLDAVIKQMDRSSKRTSTSIVVAGLLIAAALSFNLVTRYEIFGFPAAVVTFCLLAAIFLLRLFLI